MKNLIDPKGIPNVCFSLVTKDNEGTFKQQRLKRGFDDSETWSLTDTFCNFMIPRLEVYIEIMTDKTIPETKRIKRLNKILKAFNLIVRDEGVRQWTEQEKKVIKKGLKIFHKQFLNLWW